MFGMSMTEILFILAIALVVLGPEKLPKLARQIGKWVREFRRLTTDLRSAVEVDELRDDIRKQMYEPPPPRGGSFDDPYKRAAEEDRLLAEEDDEDDGIFSRYKDEPDERFEARPWDFGPAGAMALETWAPQVVDISKTVKAVTVEVVDLQDLNGAVTSRALPHPPISLLGNVVSAPIRGGLEGLRATKQE